MEIKLNKSLFIKIGVVAALLILGVFAFTRGGDGTTGLAIKNPLKTCKMVEVPYEEQEAYEEQEPYDAIEEYQVPLKYEVVSATEDWTSSNFDYYKTLTVNVRNMDSETGLFTVQMFFQTLNDPESMKENTQYIMPGETKVFFAKYDSDLGEDVSTRYTVLPGEKTLTKIVTKYKTITKYMTVTKYKMEEKCD